nr:MAG TPA: pentapeptide repeat protein [Caudoviricetes sp.]
MKGYKVFNKDWTCRDFKYEVGKTYEMEESPQCCDRGFHFCTNLADCFNYYSFNTNNKVAEVEALGEIDKDNDDTKHCTNKIKIVRELAWEEVLTLCNSGNRNSGNRNSGDCNSGNRNSGDWNSGNRNSGNRNSGDCNSGDWNSGDWNSGNRNSGNRNSGDCNSGDWNITSFSNGCFNTEEPKIYLFDKPSDWTYRDWANSDARYILNNMPTDDICWVYSEDMTDEEKEKHPEHETTGGFLRTQNKSSERQTWWKRLDERRKKEVKSIPNFDAKIFKEITGIEVGEDE